MDGSRDYAKQCYFYGMSRKGDSSSNASNGARGVDNRRSQVSRYVPRVMGDEYYYCGFRAPFYGIYRRRSRGEQVLGRKDGRLSSHSLYFIVFLSYYFHFGLFVTFHRLRVNRVNCSRRGARTRDYYYGFVFLASVSNGGYYG